MTCQPAEVAATNLSDWIATCAGGSPVLEISSPCLDPDTTISFSMEQLALICPDVALHVLKMVCCLCAGV